MIPKTTGSPIYSFFVCISLKWHLFIENVILYYFLLELDMQAYHKAHYLNPTQTK